MKLDYSSLTKNELNRYLRFKNMSRREFCKIHAKWAVGDNADKLFDFSLHPHFGNKIIQYFDIEDIVREGDFIGLETEVLLTDDVNDFRYVEILERWEKGLFVDPPSAHLDDSLIRFSDGRHRVIAAYHIGEKNVPIALPIGGPRIR